MLNNVEILNKIHPYYLLIWFFKYLVIVNKFGTRLCVVFFYNIIFILTVTFQKLIELSGTAISVRAVGTQEGVTSGDNK